MLGGERLRDLVGAAGDQIAFVGKADPVDVAAVDGRQVEQQFQRRGLLGLDAIFGADRRFERVAGVAGGEAVAIEIGGDRKLVDLARDIGIIGIEPVRIGGDAGGDAAQGRRPAALRRRGAVAADLDLVRRAEGAAGRPCGSGSG